MKIDMVLILHGLDLTNGDRYAVGRYHPYLGDKIPDEHGGIVVLPSIEFTEHNVYDLFENTVNLHRNWLSISLDDLVRGDSENATAYYSCLVPVDTELKDGFAWFPISEFEKEDQPLVTKAINKGGMNV